MAAIATLMLERFGSERAGMLLSESFTA